MLSKRTIATTVDMSELAAMPVQSFSANVLGEGINYDLTLFQEATWHPFLPHSQCPHVAAAGVEKEAVGTGVAAKEMVVVEGGAKAAGTGVTDCP